MTDQVTDILEEKRFYSALKQGDHGYPDVCVMDRDAGVAWDCIVLRRAAGEGADEFVKFTVDALNASLSPSDSITISRDDMELILAHLVLTEEKIKHLESNQPGMVAFRELMSKIRQALSSQGGEE